MSYISTKFKQLISDPSRCSDFILSDLLNVTGIEVVDASNAFVMLLEASTHLASQNWTSNELGLKKRYACLATTFEELYPHLATPDLQYIFARPCTSTVRFSILVESLLSNAVAVGSYREAIIPKYTEVRVDDLTFSIDSAISIKVYNNRVFKVEYVDGSLIHADISQINSVATYTRMDGTLWLTFEVAVQQLDYTSFLFNSIPSLAFNEHVVYTDQLSSIEVLYKSNSVYVPMKLALNARVYDPLTPTAILVPDTQSKTIQVFIPPMYTQSLVTGSIKVIVGSTKGDIDRVFSQYTEGDHSVGIDTDIILSSTKEAAFLSSTFMSKVTSPLDGGRDALSFDKLRERVVSRAFGNKMLPITRSQFANMLSDSGLTSLLYKEGVGGRTYIVTDDTPHPTLPNTQPPLPLEQYLYDDSVTLPTAFPAIPADYLDVLAKGQTYTGVRSTIAQYDTFLPIGCMTLNTRYEALVAIPGVNSFPYRLTITPSALFIQAGTNIAPTLLTSQEVDLLSDDSKVSILNKDNYLFTMFYYAIEHSNEQWMITPWSLNKPFINITDRIESDPSLPDIFKQVDYSVYTTAEGFVVTLNVESITQTGVYLPSDTFCYLRIQTEQSYVQGVSSYQGEVIYIPMTISDNGTVTSYQGLIPTMFELTPDKIGVTYNGTTVYIDGKVWVDVLYGLNSKPVGYLGNSQHLLPEQSKALMLYERIHLTLGHALSNLWTNVHSPVGKIEYLRYTEDEPYMVTADDSYTSISEVLPFSIGEDCKITYKPSHTTTQVLIIDNEIVYKHRAGDLKLDAVGRPIPITQDTQVIEFDLACVNAKVMYATDTDVLEHLSLVQTDIVHKCTYTIPELLSRSLERTHLYYRPIKTVGEALCYKDGASVGSMDLSLKPRVVLRVPAYTYSDTSARKKLQDITVRTVNLSLSRSVIGLERLISDLYQVYGSSVIAVAVYGLPDVLTTGAVSFNDPTVKAVVGVSLQPTPSNSLSLVDNISVEFELQK